MKGRILDANAIYSLINLEKYSLFKDALTLDLARYELGNAIWKEAFFSKSITLPENLPTIVLAPPSGSLLYSC